MKAIKLMLFVAAATMMFAACGKEDPVVGDNQMIYDGKLYQGEGRGSIQNDFAELSCYSETEGQLFAIDCHIENLTSTNTYDLTKVDTEHGLHFHILVEGPGMQAEDIFDLQYQNSPQLWYFLNGDNVSGTSAFVSGTATATVSDEKITLDVSGELVNGKSLAFRIVAPRD